MYASIRKAQANPGAVAEIARRIQENFVPIVSQVPGFEAYYTVDLGGDMVATVSVFASQAGAEESGRRAAEWVQRDLGSLLASQLDVMVGEVLVHQAV